MFGGVSKLCTCASVCVCVRYSKMCLLMYVYVYTLTHSHWSHFPGLDFIISHSPPATFPLLDLPSCPQVG